MELMEGLGPLYEAVLNGDLQTAKAVTARALAEGGEPLRLVQDWMMPAMAEVGRRFEYNKNYFGADNWPEPHYFVLDRGR